MFEKISLDTTRRITESGLGGIIIGTGVAVERLINQGSDMGTVLLAGGIQSISTFFMALGSISFYDWMVENFPGEMTESMKKIAIGGGLASLSGVVNYVGQSQTQGSIEESIAMFSLAGTGLIIYENQMGPKIKREILENKYTTLEIILNLGNTLGLK